MANFEEIGRTIDEELAGLKLYVEREMKPGTRRQLVRALRSASLRLAKLARKVEGRRAGSAAGDAK